MKADATVAKDGSGTHGEIMKAIEMVGGGSSTKMDSWSKFVIYIKAGTYHEIIRVPTNVKNVMLIGDGKDKTVIVGNRSADDGWSTFQSATTGIMGYEFMAKGITFINDAGPNKRQAVALRDGSDKSVIYQCAIRGYHSPSTLIQRGNFLKTLMYSAQLISYSETPQLIVWLPATGVDFDSELLR